MAHLTQFPVLAAVNTRCLKGNHRTIKEWSRGCYLSHQKYCQPCRVCFLVLRSALMFIMLNLFIYKNKHFSFMQTVTCTVVHFQILAEFGVKMKLKVAPNSQPQMDHLPQSSVIVSDPVVPLTFIASCNSTINDALCTSKSLFNQMFPNSWIMRKNKFYSVC